ncbi:hypothetical protein TELCIR_01581 [Teladorsagia circumcincta]|uniref:Uncharacterized protein n=1 Tax=Teladorsagia circumcincta TaxID=45464 RepID=A0A2G9V3Q4_TELCI|nr:hypothetical protein TELCIR_01581 [Teladorsagia circumcincta]
MHRLSLSSLILLSDTYTRYTMETEQTLWIMAKNYFSLAQKAPISSVVAITELKELPVLKTIEKRRITPVRTANVDETFLYEYGSLNMP